MYIYIHMYVYKIAITIDCNQYSFEILLSHSYYQCFNLPKV